MKKTALIIIFLFLASIVLGQEEDSPFALLDLQGSSITLAGGSYLSVDATELKRLLDSDVASLVINTQVPYEGEIPGTDIFIPGNDIETYFSILPKFKDHPIVVYSYDGRLSALAAETLIDLGYSNVILASGGIAQWESTGFLSVDAFEGRSADAEFVDLEIVSSRLGIPRNRFVASPIDNDPFLGNAETSLVLIEFSDVNCPYCARYHTESLPRLYQEFIDLGLLKYVYKDYVSVGGNMSRQVALANECVREQTDDASFFSYLTQVYSITGRKNLIAALSLAREAGLDAEAIQECVDEERYASLIDSDSIAARESGARGTPAFLIGYVQESGLVEGIPFQGALPYDNFATYIQAFIAAAQ